MMATLAGGHAFVEAGRQKHNCKPLRPRPRAPSRHPRRFRADNPLFSGLALDDGWLSTLDIFNLQTNASLVTLSACKPVAM